MQTTDRAAFQSLLTDALAFYRQDVSTFTLSVWWEAVQPFAMEQVRKALTAHAMDPERGQFAPKPADLVRVLVGTKTDLALLAWGRVHQAFAAVGAYASPDFEDNAVHSAINDMGGWPKLCWSSLDELPHTQRRFCELYRAYKARPDEQHAMRLIGMHEQANGAKGVQGRSEVVRIGQALRIGSPL